MGTPMFAVPILKSLYQNGYPISCVYTQPPQKSKRGQKINKSPIQLISETLNIEFRTPNSLKENLDELEYFKSLEADLAIVVAYGQIIPKSYLNLTKKGFINIHASILPKWRGAAPIQRSIMNLDKETGISIMKIGEELDTGDIYEDKANFIEQDHASATYASKIQKLEGQINWKEDAKIIIGKINGLYPVPGAYFMFNGERYKILKAEIGQAQGKPGEVLSDHLEISCGDKKSIKIKEIQRQGKKPQSIGEFVLGTQIKKGSFL